MATYVATIRFTEQGMVDIQETCKRAAGIKATAKKIGAKVIDIYWTMGAFDGLIVFEAPGDETATALMLRISSAGNVQTQTARAFTSVEMEKILAMTAR